MKNSKSKGNASELSFLRLQQEAISVLAKEFLTGERDETMYERVARSVSNVLQVDGCLFLLIKSSEKQYQVLASCGLCNKSEHELTELIDDVQLRKSLESTEIQMVPDYKSSSGSGPLRKQCFEDFRSSMSVQIPGNPEALGVIAVYRTKPGFFEEVQQGFLKTISNMLAGALVRDAKELALKESEARSKAILKTAVDGIITIDDTGMITLFNQAAQKMFGYREEEVTGNNVRMLMPEPYKSEHDKYLENYKKTGAKKIIGIGREMTGLRKDGSTFPLYLAVSEFQMGNKRSFTGIVRDITDQRKLEMEVLQISDHERRRIGQDLHDGLGQMLTGIGLMSQGLEKKLRKVSPGYADQANEITNLIREADNYAKNLSRGLLPVDFEVRGLVTSLERLAVNAERLFGIKCSFQEFNSPIFHDNSVVEHLFRIAQEAISNAVKHGQAGVIRIELGSDEEFAVLRIVDDGKGFSEEWEKNKGSGIDIMRFRTQLIGANLNIHNLDGGGVALICLLPRTETVYHTDESQD